MDKKQIIRENARGALSYIVDGKRFAKCSVCGRDWNIPIWFDRQIRNGYVCPVCEGRMKREEASK